MAADAQSETETPFSSGELAVYSRFASYPFEKDHVFTKGQEGVRKRAEEKWDSEHPDAASDDPARADFVDTELVGAKIFYFEVSILFFSIRKSCFFRVAYADRAVRPRSERTRRKSMSPASTLSSHCAQRASYQLLLPPAQHQLMYSKRS